MAATISFYDYPVARGQEPTEAHARICAERGHASWTLDGKDTGVCPRCGEVTIPALVATEAGDEITIRPGVEPGRLALHLCDSASDSASAALTPTEARRLAALLTAFADVEDAP